MIVKKRQSQIVRTFSHAIVVRLRLRKNLLSCLVTALLCLGLFLQAKTDIMKQNTIFVASAATLTTWISA